MNTRVKLLDTIMNESFYQILQLFATSWSRFVYYNPISGQFVLDLDSLRWGWCPIEENFRYDERGCYFDPLLITARSTLDPKSVALLSLVVRRYQVPTVGLKDVRV